MLGMDMGDSTTSKSNSMSGMNMDMNSTSGCESMGMMTYFHTGKCEYIFFERLHTQSVGGIIGACFAIFALAILYEAVKVFREYLLQQAMIAANKHSVGNGSSSQEIIVFNDNNAGSSKLPAWTTYSNCSAGASGALRSAITGMRIHMMSSSHFIQTLLHMFQVLISYCLMLMFMTYNAWLCIAVILGAGVGYFLFGWRKAIIELLYF